MNYASDRMARIKPSASVAASAKARELKAAGIDVINCGLGEPDFDTPSHIIEAAHQAAQSGETRYPPMNGTLALKQAVVDKFARDNQLKYSLDEIIVSNGVKQILFNCMMASVNKGDEVLLCAPYFGTYRDIVLMVDGVPVSLPCPAEDGFRLTPERLEAAITANTRWLLLNLPSNPAGATYNAEQMQALGDVLAKHPQVMVLSDEVYEHIIFDDKPFVSFASACPDLLDRTLTANGVSKAYAMTGWRIGYAGGPLPLIQAMSKVQAQVSSGACSIAQAAAAAALNGPQDAVKKFVSAYQRRRDLVYQRVQNIPGLTLNPPDGAFYALIGCESYIGSTTPDGKTIESDVDFCVYLLDEARVATVAGSAYALSPYFRVSTATSDESLNKAMDRIETSVAKLTLAL